MTKQPLITMRGITKRFGGVTALSDVDLDAHAGEVLAIVGDNGAGKSTLVLGMPLLDNKRMRSETERILLDRLGVRLKSMDAPTESLSGGQRQAVAIARAVYQEDLKLLVMDEPTAALGPQETARTLKLIEAVKAQGIAVILISHSLDDVFQVSDRIHVQRRGRRVGVVETSQSTVQEVLGLIVGAEEAA